MNAPAPSTSTTRPFSSERRTSPGRHAGGVRQSRVHAPPIGTRPKVPTKRLLDIEDVLRWAFREELPKRRDENDERPREYRAVSPMFAMAALGGRVENFSREPGFPLAMGDAHPDALIVEAAVLELSRFADHRFEGPLGLLDGLLPGLDEHAAMAGAMSQIVELVRIKARLGARPTLPASPIPAAIIGRNGKVQVLILRSEMRAGTDGIMRPHLIEEPCGAKDRDRYPTGAYCALHWDDPKTILIERAQYAAYWAALDLLAHELAGKLASVGVLPPAAAQRPWTGEEDAAKPKRIFDNPVSRARLRDQREDQVVEYLLRHRRRSAKRRPPAPKAAPAAATGA